jgi:hypothetical protein
LLERASSKAIKSTKKNKKKQKALDDAETADQQISPHDSSSNSNNGRSSSRDTCGSAAAAAPADVAAVNALPASGSAGMSAAAEQPAAAATAAAAAERKSSRLQGDALEPMLRAASPLDDWEALATEDVSKDPWPVRPQQQQQQQQSSRSHPPADWAPEAAAGSGQQGEAGDDDEDVPEGFGLPRTSSGSSRLERLSSGTPSYAASTRAAAAHAAPVVGLSAAAAASAAFATIRLVDAALLTEEQQRQRFVRVLDLMQPAFESLLVTLDEQQLQVLACIEEADLAALLQQPQAERRLVAFVNQVVRREPQLAFKTARAAVASAGEAAAAVLALDKGGARRCIRPQQLLPEHAEALAAEFPG